MKLKPVGRKIEGVIFSSVHEQVRTYVIGLVHNSITPSALATFRVSLNFSIRPLALSSIISIKTLIRKLKTS